MGLESNSDAVRGGLGSNGAVSEPPLSSKPCPRKPLELLFWQAHGGENPLWDSDDPGFKSGAEYNTPWDWTQVSLSGHQAYCVKGGTDLLAKFFFSTSMDFVFSRETSSCLSRSPLHKTLGYCQIIRVNLILRLDRRWLWMGKGQRFYQMRGLHKLRVYAWFCFNS